MKKFLIIANMLFASNMVWGVPDIAFFQSEKRNLVDICRTETPQNLSSEQKSNLEEVISDIESGGPNNVDEYGYTPIMKVLSYGFNWLVEDLVRAEKSGENPELLNYVDGDGSNLLLLAVESGNLTTIKWLVEEKGFEDKINDENNYKDTPIIYAIQGGYTEIVEYLISNGAKIDDAVFNVAESEYQRTKSEKSKEIFEIIWKKYFEDRL